MNHPASDDWHVRARARFPHLRDCVYLNTASTGLAWDGQGAAAAGFWDEAMRDGYDAREVWRARSAAARDRVARLLGVAAEDVQFAGNTTEALALVARSLRWRAGERIVLAADEFPSVRMAWGPAERAGVVVEPVAIDDEARRGERLAEALRPGVRVLAASHVHWETGTRLDLDALGRACRANGTLLVVDGIQALGAVPVDGRSADAYCASTFKWLLSGFGLAVLATGAALRAQCEPAVRGYLNEPPSASLQAAHANHPGLWVLEATLALLEAYGWPRVHARVDALGASLHRALAARGERLLTPFAHRAGIVSVAVADPGAAMQALRARGVHVEARGAALRVSPHFYNDEDDIQRCVEAIAALRA